MEHQKQWDFFTGRWDAGRISHAYILAGWDDQAKLSFVKKFVQRIHCEAKNAPCGMCGNCKMVDAGVFADLLVLSKTEDKDEITMPQVKEAQRFLSLAPYYGVAKAVVVMGAEAMNAEAQNRFLKTLEEPQGNALIFLLSAKPDMLLETIRSRCQRIMFSGQAPKAAANKDLLAALDGGLAEKFAYAKKADADEADVLEILSALEWHFRQKILEGLGVVRKSSVPSKQYTIEQLRTILQIIESTTQQLMLTNASKRLALETVLMET